MCGVCVCVWCLSERVNVFSYLKALETVDEILPAPALQPSSCWVVPLLLPPGGRVHGGFLREHDKYPQYT